MNRDIWSATIGATGLIIAAIVGVAWRLNDERNNIKKDLAIYNALPSASTSKEALLKHIDTNINDFLISKRSVRQDFRTIMWGFFIVIVAASGLINAALYLHNKRGEPLITAERLVIETVSLPLCLFGISTVIDGAKKQLRTKTGKVVHRERSIFHWFFSLGDVIDEVVMNSKKIESSNSISCPEATTGIQVTIRLE